MFHVTVHRALHEGGTKFYQQVKIDHTDSGQCFLIQHWGRWIRGPHGFDLEGGQRKILKTTRFNGDTEYREKLEQKLWKKKPGDRYKTTDEKNVTLKSLDDLRLYVRDTLGGSASQVRDIVAYYELTKAVTTPAAPTQPLAPITAKSKDIPVTEGWGTW